MREPTGSYNRPSDEELKKRLTARQYDVMCNNGTEAPYSSEYWDSDAEGIYVNAVTGEPLFTSYDKFSSGCGWPSFSKPIDEASIREKNDTSHGMVRTEVRSTGGDFHLGHVFTDGPEERGGLRYCINGAAIRFIPREDIEVEGYSYLLQYLKSREREAENKK